MVLPSTPHLDALALAARLPTLRLLVQYDCTTDGAGARSPSWSFAYLADVDFDAAELAAELGSALGTDAIALVDLAEASASLQHHVASLGHPVLERPAEFDRFIRDASLSSRNSTVIAKASPWRRTQKKLA